MSRERVTAVGEMTSLADRKRRAGERLFIGLQGHAVDDDLRKLVRELRPSGFVLFARNVAEPKQVADLNRELTSLADPHRPILIAVDQEGGRVQRIREPATRWPTMRVVGQAEQHTEEVSRAMARELRAMGFHLNFAPVADVDSEPKNPVIGDRSFGRTAKDVARHVAAFVRGHQDEGIIACAKHFPGHGDTRQDSHHDLPIVEREDRDLREVELAPFRAAIDAGVGTVMTAHVVYPAWDEDRPATLSSRIIPQLLRQEMAFDGVVFSDDLEMKAVMGRYSIDEQVDYMTKASVDVLLCCNSLELQVAAFQALVRAQEEDAVQETRFEENERRVKALRVRFLGARPPAPIELVGTARHRDLAMLVTARGQG